MLLLLTAVVIQWFLYVYIIRYVWNSVLVPTFHANLKPIGLASAGLLLVLCRILFTNHVYLPRHMLSPCEEACVDACNGL